MPLPPPKHGQRILGKLLPPKPQETRLRQPKRSTLDRLDRLPGWSPQVVEQRTVEALDKGPEDLQYWYDPPGLPTRVTYYREQTVVVSGWEPLTPDTLTKWGTKRPWLLHPSLEPLLTADEAGRPKLKDVLHKGYRLWAGSCVVCKKSTVANSQHFQQGLRCLHCSANHKGVLGSSLTKGANLFIAGNNPLGDKLYLLSADTKEAATEKAKSNGFAWVTPIHATRKGRTIQLPTPPDPPDRPEDCWAFPLEDFPPNFTKATNAWQGPDSREWAWFLAPKEEDLDPYVPATTLVSFDDFM